METKSLVAIVAAALLVILAASLVLTGTGPADTHSTSTTVPVSMEEQASPENEAVAAVETDWANETDDVEIGEMI